MRVVALRVRRQNIIISYQSQVAVVARLPFRLIEPRVLHRPIRLCITNLY